MFGHFARNRANAGAHVVSGVVLTSLVVLMGACQDSATDPTATPGATAPSFAKGGGGGPAGGGGATGGKIVFVSQRDQPGNVDIYMSNADGTGVTRLTTDPGVDDQPALSNSGQRVTFVSSRYGGKTVFVKDLVGPGFWQLTAGNVCANPAWSPDDARVAFSCFINGDNEIYTANWYGGGIVQLTDNVSSDISPSYSPRTSYMTFATTRDGGNYEIYSMRTDGTSATRLTNSVGPDLDPAWSPDGKLIAFISSRGGTGLDLYTMKTDGTQVTRLTADGFTQEQPSWSPDGKKIAFESYESGILAVHTMNLDGTSRMRITDYAASHPSWGR